MSQTTADAERLRVMEERAAWTEEQRRAHVERYAAPLIQSWTDDWAPILEEVQRGTGLTRTDALLYLSFMQMYSWRIATEKTADIQARAARFMDRAEQEWDEGETWRAADD